MWPKTAFIHVVLVASLLAMTVPVAAEIPVVDEAADSQCAAVRAEGHDMGAVENESAASGRPDSEPQCRELREDLQYTAYGEPLFLAETYNCKNTIGYNICVGTFYRGCTFWFSFGLGGCQTHGIEGI